MRFTDELELLEQEAPTPPVSGMLKFYSKPSGLFYMRNDGVEKPVGGETPSNMVTTDTTQTVSGNKNFTGTLTINSTSLVLTNDARLSDSRTPTAHTHGVTDLTATGTRDATTFLRGDNTWAAPTFTAPSNMVTTDTTQTISGTKTFSTTPLFGILDFTHQPAGVPAPASGHTVIYVSASDGTLRTKDSDNVNRTYVDTSTNQTIAGNKTFTGIMSMAATANPAFQFTDSTASRSGRFALASAAGNYHTNSQAFDTVFRGDAVANDQGILLAAGPTSTGYLRVGSAGVVVGGTLSEGVNRVYSAGNKVPVSGISATGTADATTYLRGDGTWTAVAAGGSTAANVVLSANTTAHKQTVSVSTAPPAAPAVGDVWIVPDINTGAAISAGGAAPANMVTLDTAQTITAAKTFNVAPSVPTGSFGVSVLSTTGTASASTFLRGDGTWATPAPPDLSAYVTLAGAQTVSGVKTFTAAPVLPDASVPLAAISATGTRDATTSLRGDGTWVAVNPITVPFSFAGTITTKTGAMKFPIAVACIVESVMITAGTASAGSAIIADVNRNGTTIYTTQANRPMLTAGSVIATAPSPAVTTFAAGDYITVDIDQVGSTTAGADVMVVVRLRRA